MGLPKGPTEGGSGGKRGHSNMEHWGYTEEVKFVARKLRRIENKKAIEEQLNSHPFDQSEESND